MRSLRISPSARTLILCVMGVASGSLLTAAVVATGGGASSAAHQNADRAVPAQAALHDAWAAGVDGQQVLSEFVQTQDPAARTVMLSRLQSDVQEQSNAWSAYKKHALGLPGESALQQSFEASHARTAKFATELLGMAGENPALAKTLAQERDEYDKSISALDALESRIYDPAIRDHAATFVSAISDVRRTTYLTFAALALIFSAVGGWLMRGARREERSLRSNAAETSAAAQFAHFDTSLQRALDMEQTEDAVYAIIEHALKIVDADVPSELLLADSSHAHFHRMFSTDPGADAACGVITPEACPATLTGQTQFFDDSSELDTCPFLRVRSDRVWATCVPVSIAGRSTGVIHAQRPVEFPRGDTTRHLQLIGRKAGERIGMLRAFARSEIQADTDPLTGLLNRRSLEERVRRLDDAELPFVVAYADLDQFKLLNDVHGHDAGDRALRLFARVLRDSVRPNDIPTRFGGEEFVTVLPECSIEDAVTVANRVRSALCDALANGTLPPFTVSIGLAGSESGLTFRQTLDAADQALLRAKRTGRDRIVISGAEPPDDDSPAALDRLDATPLHTTVGPEVSRESARNLDPKA